MFDTSWIADLDARSASEMVVATQTELREQELRELLLAAHWAALHSGDTLPVKASGRCFLAPSAPSSSVVPGPRRWLSLRVPSWDC